jgi:hypothetical protein
MAGTDSVPRRLGEYERLKANFGVSYTFSFEVTWTFLLGEAPARRELDQSFAPGSYRTVPASFATG